jgi:hypothetical protein
MRQLLAIQGMVLVVFVLLGNGLRSISMSTVSLSQGEFASFLNISVERTDILIEALLGAALVALAVAPFVIFARSAARVARKAAYLAAISYLAVGVTMHADPDLLTREIVIVAAFAFGGFAVAFFAPLAQFAISGVDDEKSRVALTTIWTAAQPIAFLITPQLVKHFSFEIGVGNFFLLLSALPLLFLALSPMAFPSAMKAQAVSAPQVPWPRLTTFVLLILLFEAATAAITLAGFLSVVSLVLTAALVAALAIVAAMRRRLLAGGTAVPLDVKIPLLILLVIQIPTTGLYENAFLIKHFCSAAFIADRATVGAVCQVAAVLVTGAALQRWRCMQDWLLWLAISLLLIGTVMACLYPYHPTDQFLFVASRMTTATAMGIASAVLVNAILAAGAMNRMVMMAPAFLMIIGTELGIEVLEIVMEISQLRGADENEAYEAVFLAQVVSVLVATGLLGWRLTGRLAAAGWLAQAAASPPTTR